MAYVDRQTGTQRAASLASAAILQGGIGAILIYGLATTVLVPPKDGHLPSSDFPLTPPPPEHVPPPQPAASSAPSETSIDTVTSPLDTNTTGPTVPSGPPIASDPYVAPVAQPSFPPLPQPPHFTARGPQPLGDRARWVTTDDYPSSEIRAEHSGVTGYRLSIAANGKVTGCEVMRSSGWPKLDAATCANVARRAKFEPGSDTSGMKAAGSYSGSVVWTIPR
ncbi:MAG: TonB family protein [Candidatus Andeanibacterium colombiense]|uniref:TonB family protein n=1 Tax=Candidatus Andeanibacterium colombiense TaxID=3121345 RepID=A0AAJ5X8S3_9SPHN|nr:MAG: TonB family protein [Sphingomonadaceae bacterium]